MSTPGRSSSRSGHSVGVLVTDSTASNSKKDTRYPGGREQGFQKMKERNGVMMEKRRNIFLQSTTRLSLPLRSPCLPTPPPPPFMEYTGAYGRRYIPNHMCIHKPQRIPLYTYILTVYACRCASQDTYHRRRKYPQNRQIGSKKGRERYVCSV